MLQLHSLIDAEDFQNIDQINLKMKELTAEGKLEERANALNADNPKWKAQQLAYDALETGDAAEALQLVAKALRLDPDCTDAQRFMVVFSRPTPEQEIKLLIDVISRAEKNFGPEFMEEANGHFWSKIETRPYMRTMQHLAEAYVEYGDRESAVRILERMLELNPGDNQGMRHTLIGSYFAVGNLDGVRRILEAYPGQEKYDALFAWARAIELRVKESDEAEAALRRAREVNPHVLPFVDGTKPLSRTKPSYYKPGDINEAQLAAGHLLPAIRGYPDLLKWLTRLA